MDWEDLNRLHVVSKIKEIIGKWYNLDCVFLDAKGRLKTNIFKSDYSLNGQFLSAQIESVKGRETFKIDLDNTFDEFFKLNESLAIMPSSLENINFICSKILVNEQCLGMVIGYPFVFNNKNEDLKKSFKNHFQNWETDSLSEEKAFVSVQSSDNNLEYLKDLIKSGIILFFLKSPPPITFPALAEA